MDDTTNTDQTATPQTPVEAETVTPTTAAEVPQTPDTEANPAPDDGVKTEESVPATPEAPSAPQAPTTGADGTQVQPVQVKESLCSLHEDLNAVVTKLKNSDIAAAHDISVVVATLEAAKAWVVEKVEAYDPDLAATLK